MDNNNNGFQPRRQQEPFKLDINFDDDDLLYADSDLADDIPVPAKPKGEVYFSNPPPAAPARPQTMANAGSSKPKKPAKKRNKRGLSSAMILVIVSLCLSIVLSYVGITAMRDIFAIGKDPLNTREVSVVLPHNATTDEVIDILAQQGLIQQRWISQIYARFTYWLVNRNVVNPPAPIYLPGEHMVCISWALEEMLDSMRPRRGVYQTVTVNFHENMTARQIFDRLHDNRVVSRDSLMRAMHSGEFDYHFINNLGDTSLRFFRLEGYLFPDTYEFFVNESPHSVLRRFFDNFNRRWTDEHAARAAELGMTTDQIIILASMIQMEAANAQQMRQVSGVFHNRLNNPSQFPHLQSEATQHYIMNNVAQHVESGMLASINQVYNTYVRPGLPAGPIGNPGMDAIEAALWPADSNYYFFQHDRNGQIYLSATRQEHESTRSRLMLEGLLR
ncbi:MAG: endolytic transglycosylase MltG [Oscillospiraceae bacterium]|nr:endolytic transglycosylase MltG [Oscillospiraceae bacterium]